LIKATYYKYILQFKTPSGTSRGILKTKETWFLYLSKEGKFGVGECGLFRGLSIDDRPDYEDKLKWVCNNIELGLDILLAKTIHFPSIQIGLEQAFLSLQSPSPFKLFVSNFTESNKAIDINGLIWMGDREFMNDQIKEKIALGFRCLKMKIGAIDFATEIQLLASIRKEFSINDIELRVDANGAFKPSEALEKLKILSNYDLHSIEQPIHQGNYQEMALLCEKTPLPIALDEELIGVFNVTKRTKMLQIIKPQYIILKPSLVGGFKESLEWIELAKESGIGWWVTSALESNVGLNAIAQWTATLKSSMPQGLGTGGLFTNNFDSPLEVNKGGLYYNKNKNWNFNLI
jgi:o-succinylbenzoate synthase